MPKPRSTKARDAELSSLQRGALAAAMLWGGERAAQILAGLADTSPVRCLDVAGRMTAAPRRARARELAALVAEIRMPRPRGAHRIHPDWLEHALAGATQRVRRAIFAPANSPAGCLPPAVRTWLQRRVYAELVPMPTHSPPPPEHLTCGDLPTLSPQSLTRGLERVGIAHIASPHPGRSKPASPFIRAGCRALAPHVRRHGGDLARQIAQRLPRALGLAVLAELCGRHATASLDDVPAWPEIANLLYN